MSNLLIFFLIPLILASHRLKLDSLEITSSAFESNQPIPTKYTLYGQNILPELYISNIPSETQSLALILEDPDCKSGNFIQYIVKNIPKETTIIKENQNIGVEIINSWGYGKYGGPKPPQGDGVHRYYWRVYALDKVKMDANNVDEFRKEVEEHKIAEGF